MEPDISIIVCVNNFGIASGYILRDFEDLDRDRFEVIVLPNEHNRAYSSIAAAYNDGASRAKGRYLLFVHQDVRVDNSAWFKRCHEFCTRNQFGIAGASGVVGRRIFYSDLEVLKTCPELGFGTVKIADLVDESLFIISRDVWEAYRFNSELVDDFHLCAAEYSLRMRVAGKPVLLLPLAYSHHNLAPHSQSRREQGLKKRRHVMNWMSSAIRLKRAYPQVDIETLQGPISWKLILTYYIFYFIFMAVFPTLGLEIIDGLLRNGGYLVFNRTVKRFRYT